jgi:hypothetical protein
MQERKLERIEPFEAKSEKHSIFCIECGEPATKVAYFSIDEATIVEKYCDKCIKNVQDS